MAKNTGDGFRRGAVTARTQFQRLDGNYQKRDERSGHFMEVKGGRKPFKGVAKDPTVATHRTRSYKRCKP